MTETELKERLKAFSVRIIKMVDSLPNTISGRAVGSQIVRSGTSPAANYRAACLAKSEKDFINKLKIVEEELDETVHWMEIIMEADILPAQRLEPLYNEGVELLKIIVSSIVSTKKHLNGK
ncbi:MAG: four helix bundle protein [Alloprevotella sp.]|nr:four helix bundle protein [Alloprevotella sp.]MBR1732613.1 four helix bundle protein [Alloprevotella sp.]